MVPGRARRATVIVAMLMMCGSAAPHAQTKQTPLASVLIGPDVIAAILSQQQVDALGRQLAIDINSLPVQTAAYGSRELGALRLNYGTLFLERAFPIGFRKFHAFVSVQAARWADLDGVDMDEGDFTHRAAAFLDRPAIDSRARITINSQTTTFGAAYGATPNLDLGVAIPIQRVCVQGSRTVTKAPGGVEQAAVDSCNAGIGDVVVKMKYTKGISEDGDPILRWGLQAAMALPTGNTADLTGKGTTQATLAFLVTKDRGWWQPTASIGATIGGSGATFKTVELFGQQNFVLDRIGAPPSINVGAGVNLVDQSRLTASVEMIGRLLHNGVEFRASDLLGGTNLEILPDTWQPQILAAAAIKYRLANRVIGGVQAMNQLSRPGLRPSWIVGAHVTIGNLALGR